MEDHVINTGSLEKMSLETFGEVGKTALQRLKFSVIQDIEIKKQRAEKLREHLYSKEKMREFQRSLREEWWEQCKLNRKMSRWLHK